MNFERWIPALGATRKPNFVNRGVVLYYSRLALSETSWDTFFFWKWKNPRLIFSFIWDIFCHVTSPEGECFEVSLVPGHWLCTAVKVKDPTAITRLPQFLEIKSYKNNQVMKLHFSQELLALSWLGGRVFFRCYLNVGDCSSNCSMKSW